MNTSNSSTLVIVHCHIFKNAGSTFDWSLRRQFGERMMEHKGANGTVLTAEDLKRIVEGGSVRAVSSHAVHLPLPVIENVELQPALFLRHPIERVYSVYAFERRQKDDTPGSRQAKKLAFGDYVSWRLDSSSPAVIRNYQTRYCAGFLGHGGESVSPELHRRAESFIEGVLLLGVVDAYDTSMVLFERVLRDRIGAVDLRYIRQNVSSGAWTYGPIRLRGVLARLGTGMAWNSFQRGAGGDPRPEKRAEWVLESLDPEVADALLAANSHDMALYRRAKELVRSRGDAMQEIKQEMAQFLARCEALSPGRAKKLWPLNLSGQ